MRDGEVFLAGRTLPFILETNRVCFPSAIGLELYYCNRATQLTACEPSSPGSAWQVGPKFQAPTASGFRVGRWAVAVVGNCVRREFGAFIQSRRLTTNQQPWVRLWQHIPGGRTMNELGQKKPEEPLQEA